MNRIVFLIAVLYFLFNLVLPSCVKKDSSTDWSSKYNARLRYGTKMFKVFIKVCGPDIIPDEQLQDAENCSYKKLLNQTTAKLCDEEVYGNKTLEEIRRIKCLRKTRDEIYTKFMDCYSRENPEDSDIRLAKFMEFQTFSRTTKKVVLKEVAVNYTECLYKALKL